jgi:transposase
MHRSCSSGPAAVSAQGPEPAGRNTVGGPIESAYATLALSQARLLAALAGQIPGLQEVLEQGFGRHPDAEIYTSLPGLGVVLGARVLAEFGDDPHRYHDARARKNYAGTSPITCASGRKTIVLARYARNRRLGDAVHQWEAHEPDP